jgi:ferredoxin-NADP reductase
MAARVVADNWPARDVRELTFAPVHRPSFPEFVPGDHVQLQHIDGTRRDYSLIGDPGDLSGYRVAIRRVADGRGGSRLFHDALDVGDLVFVSYPQPGIRLATGTSRHLFIAGGIGVTAVLGLVRGLPDGSVANVHYCVRSRSNAAYVDELIATGAHVTVHASGSGGRLDVQAQLAVAQRDTTVYHCGPASLMNAVDESTRHWPEGSVLSESFTGSATTAGELLGEPFDAWLALSRRMIHVGGRESLLQAMLREGVPIDYSCEGGVCGSCVLDVASGVIEHRDQCLTEHDRLHAMAACVSRGTGRISVRA